MILSITNHNDFQLFLRRKLPALIQCKLIPPKKLRKFVAAMWLFNCDAAIPVFPQLYSEKGRPTKHCPIRLLRSLVLMHLAGFHSITKWVDEIKSNDIYAVLSGFTTESAPGIGTFYDFINRLWADKTNYSKCLRNFSAKPRKSKKDASGKMPLRKPGVVDRLVKKALKNRVFSRTPERFLQSIFAECIVETALQNGSLKSKLENGIVNLLSPIAGDGTAIKTAASPYGVKTCDCRKNKIYNCKCPRYFGDFHANWGWDSHEEHYFYGRHFYFIASPDHDLPLFFCSAQASRHDSAHGVVAISQFRHFNKNVSFNGVCLDSAHDCLSFYKLINHWKAEAFIDLKREPASASAVNDKGQPLCKANIPMINHGWCNSRGRRKWRCPKHTGSKASVANAKSICKESCSTSAYGHTLYTFPENNLRLFPKTPRGSESWKTTYNSRTSVERVNKKVTVDYNIERCRVRSNKHWFVRGFLISICLHLDVWSKAINQKGTEIVDWLKK